MTASRRRKPGIKLLNLALQGGGAHGAFTWGVLDRLLGDERIEIGAISGASAGAINAVVVAEGLAEGGRVKARAQLETFWEAVSAALESNPLNSSLWQNFVPPWLRDLNPAASAFDMFSQFASPYVFNPADFNPLRDIIEREVDFNRVHACQTMALFVSVTNVETGRLEIITGDDVSLDAVMASACLPTLYKAVEIGGVSYWDGGYTGNPPLSPLIKGTEATDVLVVQINPERRAQVPRTSGDILHRLNEITFNASLIREIEAVEFVNRALERGGLNGLGYRPIHLHRVGGGANFENLRNASKYSGDWSFLLELRNAGRAETDRWLNANFDNIGKRGTFNGGDAAAA